MKGIKYATLLLMLAPCSLKANYADTAGKARFLSAKHTLEQMLSGKEPMSYEEAIYQIENAWYTNGIDKRSFQSAINAHLNRINAIIGNQVMDNSKAPENPWERVELKKERWRTAAANYAIYSYITNASIWLQDDRVVYHMPFAYSFEDPMGTADWENTQVTHLLNNGTGNCFALASLFKIFSERLQSEATLCTAPGHIYIRHADDKGTFYNVELSSHSFPGTGTLETLTYTTSEATKNGISLRELDLKQSIALCLVYLAKGYEYRYGTKDDGFTLSCAATALQYDDHDLNAMLLKKEILEERLIAQGKDVTTLQKQSDFKAYQDWVRHIYRLGYREMPFEMKNRLIKGWTRDTIMQLAGEDHTPQRLPDTNLQPTRYASLSWGLFDEEMKTKRLEKYGRTVFDTKTGKIAGFVDNDVLYNQYNFDPVVFAWNIDPLAHKYPGISPYSFVADNPIIFLDKDGRELQLVGDAKSLTGFQTAIEVASNGQIKLNIGENGITTLSIVGDKPLSEKNQKFYSTLNEVINDKNTTRVFVASDQDNSRTSQFLGGYENIKYPGVKNFGSLDYQDMQEVEKGTNGNLSVLGFTTHEIWENYYKQVIDPSANFLDAHQAAIEKQSDVDNVTDLSLKGNLEANSDGSVSGEVKVKYKDSNGSKHQSKIIVTEGNPTDIKSK